MTRPPAGPPDSAVADFNRTLVRERTLPAWCRWRLAAPGLGTRLDALASIVARGPLSLALARLPATESLGARVGLAAFRGARPEELIDWARRALTPNLRALEVLARLRRDEGVERLLVVSRGTPRLAVEAW